jgi:hypothetical protein
MDYEKLKAMPKGTFERNRDKVFALSSAINKELIDAGYGNYTISELMQMRNDITKPAPEILVRFAANELDRRDYVNEEKMRVEFSGTLRPLPKHLC